MPENNPAIATLASNIKQGIEARLKDLHTALPGIIESFDPATQLASVQPAIKRVFKEQEENTETFEQVALPKLINVPVLFPRGGGFSLTFPVAAGDECLIVFSERSYDLWHEFGTVREPGARRFHDLSDAIVFVGLSSKPNKITDYNADSVEMRNDSGDAFIRITSNKDIESTAAGSIIDQCDALNVTATTSATITAPIITLAGNVVITGSLSMTGGEGVGDATIGGSVSITGTSTASDHISSGISGSGHTHTQGVDAGGDAQIDTGAPQ